MTYQLSILRPLLLCMNVWSTHVLEYPSALTCHDTSFPLLSNYTSFPLSSTAPKFPHFCFHRNTNPIQLCSRLDIILRLRECDSSTTLSSPRSTPRRWCLVFWRSTTDPTSDLEAWPPNPPVVPAICSSGSASTLTAPTKNICARRDLWDDECVE